MIRECPCELPRSWTRGNCSNTNTDRPRRASSNAAAEPMPPAPITMTSKLDFAMMSGILVGRIEGGILSLPILLSDLTGYPEIELPPLQVHPHDFHTQLIPEPIPVPMPTA